MQPKVSMVMPCYNKAKYIGGMLESVYNQVWDNVELIMVNDGSTDGTREIIAQWEPRLRGRGYEVVVVDQENAGTADTVKKGLSLATGDFVCSVDCDDRLHPEYVSKMASFLLSNPEYDMVACDFELLWRTAKGEIVDVALEYKPPSDKNFFENLLLKMSIPGVWQFLVRAEYMKACRVVENFFERAYLEKSFLETLPKNEKIYVTQEPSFLIPLAAGGGRVFFLKDRLYIYNLFDSPYNITRRKDSPSYTCVRNYIMQHMVNALDMTQKEKKRVNLLLELSLIAQRFLKTIIFDREGAHERACAAEAADCVNRIFTPSPKISPELILKTGDTVFFQAIAYTVREDKKTKPDFSVKGRIIGIGACGAMGKELVPALAGTSLQCDILWDSAAKDGDCLDGIRITKPEFEELLPNDIILILSRRRNLREFVENNLNKNMLVKCLSFFDVLDFLSGHYYEKLYDCRLAID